MRPFLNLDNAVRDELEALFGLPPERTRTKFHIPNLSRSITPLIWVNAYIFDTRWNQIVDILQVLAMTK